MAKTKTIKIIRRIYGEDTANKAKTCNIFTPFRKVAELCSRKEEEEQNKKTGKKFAHVT